jgi:hypothetical protein
MDEMKRCPKCGQLVKSAALKCRYCDYWFDTVVPNVNNSQQQAEDARRRQEEDARRRQEEDARRRQEEDARRRQEEEFRRQREEDLRNRQDSNSMSYGVGQPKITVMEVISEGLQIGLKNFFSLFLASILYVLTIWIPYINVGTTIAMQTLPIELSKNTQSMISPTFLFGAKYRQYMGEYFTLIGLMFMSLFPAFLFGIIPGIIINLGWSLALYLMIDKEVSPTESLVMSNKMTYGYKWTIFFVYLLLSVLMMVAVFLVAFLFGLAKLDLLGQLFSLLVMVLWMVAKIGCDTVIYRNLSK